MSHYLMSRISAQLLAHVASFSPTEVMHFSIAVLYQPCPANLLSCAIQPA